MNRHCIIPRIRAFPVFALTILIAATAALAQQPAANQQTNRAASAAPRDYSKGFEQFYKLGLPNVGKATYVKLDVYSGRFGSMSEMSMGELGLSGNAWILQEDKKGKSVFVMSSCRTQDVYDFKTLQEEHEKKAKESKSGGIGIPFPQFGGQDDKISGKWSRVDPKKDADRIISFLNKFKDQAEEKSYIMEYSRGYGQLLFCAIHFHAAGLTNEANTIAGLLFDAAGDNRKVLMQGLDILGDARYDAAYEAFQQTGNWAEFQQALAAMLGQFSAGWKKAPAVRMLADKVKERAAQAEPPAVIGEALTDQDKTLARALADERISALELQMGGGFGLWVLPATSSRYPGMPVPSNVLYRITHRGLASVPLLLALVKDETLTRIDMSALSGGGYSHYYSSYSGNDEISPEEQQRQILQLYDNMSRPLTRGEIAVHFLKAILPSAEGESGRHGQENLTTEDILDRMPEWIKANKGRTPSELGRMYLKEGSRNQRQAAFQFLTKSKSDEDTAAMEKYLLDLEGDEAANQSRLAAQYVVERGEKAKAFSEKYQAKLTAQLKALEENKDGDASDARSAKYKKMAIEQALQVMQKSTSAKSAKELLAEIAKDEGDASSSYTVLAARLKQEKPDVGLTMLLESAIAAKDGYTAVALIRLTGNMRNSPAETMVLDDNSDIEPYEIPDAEPAAEPDGESADKGKKPDIKTHADLWKKLLADTRPAENDGEGFSGINQTVGDAAAEHIEFFYGDARRTRNRSYYQVMSVAPRRMQALTRARAEARLAGSEIPPYPEFEELSKDESAKLVENIVKTPDSEMSRRLDALALNEFYALAKACATNAALAARLVARANTVKSVTVEGLAPEWQKELESLRGKPVQKDVLEKALANCENIVAQNCVADFTVIRLSCLDGICIKASVTPTNSPGFIRRQKKGAIVSRNEISHIAGHYRSPGSLAVAFWPVGAGASPVSEKAPATDQDKRLEQAIQNLKAGADADMKQGQADFWKAIDGFLMGKDNVCVSATVHLEGLPVLIPPTPAQKTVNSKQ